MELNLVDRNQRIPAGLVDGSVEFFLYENEVHCLYNGKRYSFNEFPQYILDIVDEEMSKDDIAIASLMDWGLEDAASQMRQYIACKWGGYDNNADICGNGKIQPAEYVDCGRRDTCPYQGKLCTSIKLKNGLLTKEDIAVLIRIGQHLLDKEIADVLNISTHAVRHRKDSIAKKSGLDGERKTALVGLAYQLGLVNY